MRRHHIKPRDRWQTTVERQGLTFHTVDGYAYWDESAFYSFTTADIDALEAATRELHRMCLAAAAYAIDEKRWESLGVPSIFADWIAESWRRGDRPLYGRFDLAYDGFQPPKLMEYNADTPTALVEAAVTQWYWMQDCFPELDQWNSIHERLVAAWPRVLPIGVEQVHFACLYDVDEDWMTINYLRDTAMQAGLSTTPIAVEDLGWCESRRDFVGERDESIRALFKLYPWEWVLREPFARHLPDCRTHWIEPPWKTMLSTKALLPLLWELFPGHPNLLEASHAALPGDAVRKRIHGREGANVQLISAGRVIEETAGPYDGEFVYQAYFELPTFHDRHPIIGTWMVGDESCGMGVREDCSRITRNTSSFVPHVIRD